MAVERKNSKASTRITNIQGRSIATYSGVKPDVNPDDLLEFAGAVALLRGQANGFVYLVETHDLEDVI